MHSDPDHGRLWSHDTVVVSIGETRRFNLREIPSGADNTINTANKVMPKKGGVKGYDSTVKKETSKGSEEQEHYSFHLFDGDVFYMTHGCQDLFQHCVMKSEGSSNNSPRSSIVFKKSLPGLGGKRGHGLVKSKPADMTSNAKISPYKPVNPSTSSKTTTNTPKKSVSIPNKIVRTGTDIKKSKPLPASPSKNKK